MVIISIAFERKQRFKGLSSLANMKSLWSMLRARIFHLNYWQQIYKSDLKFDINIERKNFQSKSIVYRILLENQVLETGNDYGHTAHNG